MLPTVPGFEPGSFNCRSTALRAREPENFEFSPGFENAKRSGFRNFRVPEVWRLLKLFRVFEKLRYLKIFSSRSIATLEFKIFLGVVIHMKNNTHINFRIKPSKTCFKITQIF